MTASISISMRHAGLRELATTTMVAAGRIAGEEFAVNAADRFPVFDVGEIHAGADDVVERCAGFGQSLCGDREDAARLAGGVFVVGAHRAGSGEVNGVAHAYGAGEADDGLEGRSAGDVLSHGKLSGQMISALCRQSQRKWMQRSVAILLITDH